MTESPGLEKLPIRKWDLSDGDPPQGLPALFLGRDTATYGSEGTGWVSFEPEFECGGLYGKTAPDYQCPFQLSESRYFQAFP